MNVNQYLPTDGDGYIDCVRKLAALLHNAIDEFEKYEIEDALRARLQSARSY